jgi:predicted N-acyltransferase
MTVQYTHRVFESIDTVDVADWQQVRSACGDPFFMDPRVVTAVEIGMRSECKIWYVIVYAPDGSPVACANLSAVTIDLAHLAHPAVARVIRGFPRALRQFRELRLFLCGLPVSAGQNSLALAPHGDRRRALAELDTVVADLASRSRAHGIVYKEFGRRDLEALAPLLTLGYRRIPTLPMNCFTPAFDSFQQYLAALRSHYRYKINRSIRKLAIAGIEISLHSDPQDILALYTTEVHSLYLQVLERSNTRFETLSIELFRELTRRLPGQIELVVLSRQSRIVAFGWCQRTETTYHLLYVGVDYQLNDACDLYFNLMYAWLGRALQTGATRLEVGQTTDAFKARLGCYSEPLYAFMRGVGPVMSLINRLLAPAMVAREPSTPPLHVFNDVVEHGPPAGDVEGRTVGAT